MTSGSAVLRSVLAAVMLAGSGAFASPAAAAAGPLWVAVEDGPAGLADHTAALAVNPVNGTVAVTGFSARAEPRPGKLRNYDYATVSYGLAGGDLVRRTNEASPGDPAPGGTNDDFASDVAVDTASGSSYVTGTSDGAAGSETDYATVAYSRSGSRLWAARYVGPTGERATAVAVAVDPANGNVYVTGHGEGVADRTDMATVAYDRDGAQLWVARYNHSGNGSDFAADVAVGPDGTVYVTGNSTVVVGSDVQDRIVTIAYHADGRRDWLAEYDTAGNDRPSAIAVDPVSGTAYVAGFIDGSSDNAADAFLVAYGPGGVTRWVGSHNGAGESVAIATGVSVVPGSTIYVTGTLDATISTSYLTMAFSPSGRKWFTDVFRAPGRAENNAVEVAVDPVAGLAYVTGSSRRVQGVGDYDVLTVAYDRFGQRLRAELYDGGGSETASDIDVDPRSGFVYVAGRTTAQDALGDYLTLAYTGV